MIFIVLIQKAMLFKFNEFNDGIGKLAIRPGWQLDPGTRTPPGGRVRRPDYLFYIAIATYDKNTRFSSPDTSLRRSIFITRYRTCKSPYVDTLSMIMSIDIIKNEPKHE